MLITAYFSVGYYRGDEYNLLEFADQILGKRGFEQTCWELVDKIRPSFQPMVAAIVIKVMRLIGFDSPFTQALFLRLITVGYFFFVSKMCYEHFSKHIVNKKVLLVLTYFLWFLIFVSVRFSSEIWSAMHFMVAYILWFKWREKSILKLLFIGCMVGLAFQFRYQTAIMSLGFLLWLVIFEEQRSKSISILLCGFLTVLIIGTVLDRVMYGEWVISPYNYFHENIMKDKISTYGVYPWYHFVVDLINKTYIIYGVPILVGIILLLYKKPRNPLNFVVLPFIVFHSFIGHKEMRFMFPLLFFVPFYISYVISFIGERKFLMNIIQYVFLVTNTLLLLLVMFYSFDSNVKVMKYVYENMDENDRLYVIEDNPYNRRGFELSFYYSDHRPQVIETTTFTTFKKNTEGEDYVYIFNKKMDQKYELPQNNRLIFQTLPILFTSILNMNDWTERTTMGRLYKIEL